MELNTKKNKGQIKTDLGPAWDELSEFITRDGQCSAISYMGLKGAVKHRQCGLNKGHTGGHNNLAGFSWIFDDSSLPKPSFEDWDAYKRARRLREKSAKKLSGFHEHPVHSLIMSGLSQYEYVTRLGSGLGSYVPLKPIKGYKRTGCGTPTKRERQFINKQCTSYLKERNLKIVDQEIPLTIVDKARPLRLDLLVDGFEDLAVRHYEVSASSRLEAIYAVFGELTIKADQLQLLELPKPMVHGIMIPEQGIGPADRQLIQHSCDNKGFELVLIPEPLTFTVD